MGVELTINNIAALYPHDRFELSVATAGLIAGLFGLMRFGDTHTGALAPRKDDGVHVSQFRPASHVRTRFS